MEWNWPRGNQRLLRESLLNRWFGVVVLWNVIMYLYFIPSWTLFGQFAAFAFCNEVIFQQVVALATIQELCPISLGVQFPWVGYQRTSLIASSNEHIEGIRLFQRIKHLTIWVFSPISITYFGLLQRRQLLKYQK